MIDNFKISINDVFKYGFYVVTAVIFAVTVNNKVDKCIEALDEMKTERKELSSDDKLFKQNLQNQVNANSLQIKLMAQDVEMLKQGYYPATKK